MSISIIYIVHIPFPVVIGVITGNNSIHLLHNRFFR